MNLSLFKPLIQSFKAAFCLSLGVFALVAFTPNKANATHYSGSVLAVEVLNDSTIAVSGIAFTDCQTFGLGDLLGYISYNDSSGYQSISVPINHVGYMGDYASCYGNKTSCGGSISQFQTGGHLYAGTILLPLSYRGKYCMLSFGGSDWTCALINAVNPQACNLDYVNLIRFQTGQVGDKTPVLLQHPHYAALGQANSMSHLALDPDGDSLVFSFHKPYTSGTPNAPFFAAGYDSANFINSSAPITLDPQTGVITFTPITLGTYGYGLKIEAFRAGVRISETYVDGVVTVYPDTVASGLLLSSTPLCIGDTAMLSVSNPLDHYWWSTGDTTSTIYVTQPGIYSVTGFTDAGCGFVLYDTVNYAPATPPDLSGIQWLSNGLGTVQIDSVNAGMVIVDWGDGSPIDTFLPPTLYFHTYNALGSYTVNVTACGPCACSDTALLLNLLGLDEVKRINPIGLYPNPIAAGQTLYLETAEAMESLSLYSIAGQEIGTLSAQGNTIIVPQNLSAGLYQLRLKAKNGEVYTAKLSVQ